MMSEGEIKEAMVKLELAPGGMSRSELIELCRLSLRTLIETSKKLREYREREKTRLVQDRDRP